MKELLKNINIQTTIISSVFLLLTAIIVAVIQNKSNRESSVLPTIEGVTIIDSIDNIQKFWSLLDSNTAILNAANIELIKNRNGYNTIIDLKLSNPHEVPAVLSELVFEVSSIDVFPDDRTLMALPVTWNYNFLLHPLSPNKKYNFNLSQVVEPKTADRFIVLLGNTNTTQKIKFAEYNCRISLKNHENSLKLGRYKFKIHNPINQLNNIKESQIIVID